MPARKKERRRFERVSILQEMYFEGEKSHPATNISEGGMFITALEGYLEGSVLDLKFRLFNSRHIVKVKGEVVYVNKGVGFGIKFLDLKPKDRAMIKDFVAEHSK